MYLHAGIGINEVTLLHRHSILQSVQRAKAILNMDTHPGHKTAT